MNHVQLRPDQLVNIQFHPFSPTLQRIMITVRLRPGHESMVVLRADFRPELLKSVESL